MSTDTNEKPSLPEGYKRPEVWSASDMGGTFGGMNRPTAGARSEKELSRGKHDIQLYSLGTPNGQKVTIMLEELGVEYDAWKINIMDLDQFTSGFVKVNPNSKIPAMLDYSEEMLDEAKEPLRVFESGSILLHLAEKYDRFVPKDKRNRTECLNWVMWQMGTAPVLGGGFGHFYNYAPINIEYAIDRFSMEVKRQLDVLDQHLDGKTFMVNEELSIADMAIWPWIGALFHGYKGADTFLSVHEYKHLLKWYRSLEARKAFQRGKRVNSFGENALEERHGKDDFAAEDY